MGSSRPSMATPSSVATTVRPHAHTDTHSTYGRHSTYGGTTRAHTAPLLRLTIDPRVAAVLYISTTKRKA